MRSTFEIEKPGEIEATMTITMKISEWETLKKQLSTSYPSWEFSNHVTRVVKRAHETFYGEHEGGS